MKRHVFKYGFAILLSFLFSHFVFAQVRGEEKIVFDFQCKAELDSVSFGGTDTEGYITIHHDYEPFKSFVAPHWLKGNAEFAPVGYVAGQKAQVEAVFNFACEKIANYKVLAKGTGPNNIEFEEQALTFKGNKGKYKLKKSNKAFTDKTVDYFEKFEIKWQVKIGDGKWEDAGSSINPLYVPLSQLNGCNLDTALVYYSTIHYSCEPAKGLTDKMQIIGKIWNVFASLAVPRIDKPKKPNAMLYWGTTNPLTKACRGTQGLLNYEDGNCGEWSYFMQHCLAVQGYDDVCSYKIQLKSIVDFDSIQAYTKRFINTFGKTPIETDAVFLVKKWDVKTLNKFYYVARKFMSNGLNSYTNYSGNLILPNGNSIPKGDMTGDKAQGITDPESLFTNHSVINLPNGKIYDPSYGAGTFNDILDWESKSIDAYSWRSFYISTNGSMDIYCIISPYEFEVSDKQQVVYKKI